MDCLRTPSVLSFIKFDMVSDKNANNLSAKSSDGDEYPRNKRIKLSDNALKSKLIEEISISAQHTIAINHCESSKVNPQSTAMSSERDTIEDASIITREIFTPNSARKKRKQSLDSDNIQDSVSYSSDAKRIRYHTEIQNQNVSRMSDSEQECIESQMKIYCESLMGPLFLRYISMNEDDTIEDLKMDIYAYFNIHPTQQILLHQGKSLVQDSMKLLDAGLKNGSRIQILVSMKGGPLGINDDDEQEIFSTESIDQMLIDSTMHIDAAHIQVSHPVDQLQPELPQVDECKKCSKCSKKLRISNGFKCKCDLYFCLEHRYAESHNCSFDYRTYGQLLLTRDNPIIHKKLFL